MGKYHSTLYGKISKRTPMLVKMLKKVQHEAQLDDWFPNLNKKMNCTSTP